MVGGTDATGGGGPESNPPDFFRSLGTERVHEVFLGGGSVRNGRTWRFSQKPIDRGLNRRVKRARGEVSRCVARRFRRSQLFAECGGREGGGEFSVKPFRSDTKRPSPGTKGFREVLLLFAPVVVVVVVDHVDCQKFVDGATSRSPE